MCLYALSLYEKQLPRTVGDLGRFKVRHSRGKEQHLDNKLENVLC